MITVNAFEAQALLNVLATARNTIDTYNKKETDAGYRQDNTELSEEITAAIASIGAKLKGMKNG